MICPKCMQDIAEHLRVCPHCATDLNPASKSDEPLVGAVPPPEAEDEDSAPAPKKPMGQQILIAVVLIGAIIGVNVHTGLLNPVLQSIGIMSPPKPAETPVDPPPELPPEAPPADPVTAPPIDEPPPPPADPGSPQDPAGTVPAAEPAKEPAKEPPPEEPARPKIPTDWRFNGRVYNMLTLKPVRGAQILFMGATERTATTDRRGRYSIVLPITDGGYQVFVDHPDYLEEYFDESNPPYRSMPMAIRTRLRSAKPKHKTWIGRPDRSLRRDLVLFPAISY